MRVEERPPATQKQKPSGQADARLSTQIISAVTFTCSVPEHEPEPWLAIMPLLGLGLLALNVGWRRAKEDRRR